MTAEQRAQVVRFAARKKSYCQPWSCSKCALGEEPLYKGITLCHHLGYAVCNPRVRPSKCRQFIKTHVEEFTSEEVAEVFL